MKVSFEYLAGEISIDAPHERDRASVGTQALWPEGWWAVADHLDAYIAFFAYEKDAVAYKLMLITAAVTNVGKRYRKAGQP